MARLGNQVMSQFASNCEFYALLSSDERYIQVEQSSKAFHFLPSGLNGGFSALLPAWEVLQKLSAAIPTCVCKDEGFWRQMMQNGSTCLQSCRLEEHLPKEQATLLSRLLNPMIEVGGKPANQWSTEDLLKQWPCLRQKLPSGAPHRQPLLHCRSCKRVSCTLPPQKSHLCAGWSYICLPVFCHVLV